MISAGVLCQRHQSALALRLANLNGGRYMRKWKRPHVVEIAVGMEINCYACAQL
jgi:coenzyme PQQ precursor peptide PqqA